MTVMDQLDAAWEMADAEYAAAQAEADSAAWEASVSDAEQAYYESICWQCHGQHAPDTDATFVDYRGRRFRRPFRCLCCGYETCSVQWEQTQHCGLCDAGACVKGVVLQHKRFLPLGSAGWDFYLTLVPNEPIPSEATR